MKIRSFGNDKGWRNHRTTNLDFVTTWLGQENGSFVLSFMMGNRRYEIELSQVQYKYLHDCMGRYLRNKGFRRRRGAEQTKG